MKIARTDVTPRRLIGCAITFVILYVTSLVLVTLWRPLPDEAGAWEQLRWYAVMGWLAIGSFVISQVVWRIPSATMRRRRTEDVLRRVALENEKLKLVVASYERELEHLAQPPRPVVPRQTLRTDTQHGDQW